MIQKQSRGGKIVTYVLLFVIAFITLLPFIWMFSASLKMESQVFSVPIKWIPEDAQWNNYAKIWEKIPLGLFTFNSIKITNLCFRRIILLSDLGQSVSSRNGMYDATGWWDNKCLSWFDI